MEIMMMMTILLTTLIFPWLISISMIILCGKPKKRPQPATDNTSKNTTPSSNATTPTSQASNIKFADNDDPKNKSTYGVADDVFKKKDGKPGDKKDGGGTADGNKNGGDGKAKGNKDIGKKSGGKNDSEDKTDLRSLTLEQNLAAAKKDAKPKNPAGLDRSKRLGDDPNANAVSGYAPPATPAPKPNSKEGAKKEASCYL